MDRITYQRIAGRAAELTAGVEMPPVPIEELVRSAGAEIVFEPFDLRVSGMASRRNGRRVIGVNCAHSYPRQRFTIAHELCHLEFHDDTDLRVDGEVVVVGHRNPDEPRSPRERQANLFAAELLMPDHLIKRDLDIANAMPLELAIKKLAVRYAVSASAMAVRLRDYVDFLMEPRTR
jgi:Zn-dependent peptidase ImmA (M78 family)